MQSDSKWLRGGVVVAVLMGIPGWIMLFHPSMVPHPDPPAITENAANQSDYLMVGHYILVGLFYASPAAGALFLLVAAIAVFIKPKALLVTGSASPTQPSKLVIYSAIYDAVEGGGRTYNVTEVLRKIIAGDSLVLDIENHNFSIDGHNYVPQDPKRGAEKRLVVSYSFDGEPSSVAERLEGSRIVLPEDSYIKKLEKDRDLAIDQVLELTLKVDELSKLNAQHKSDLYRMEQFRDGYKEERDKARQELQKVKDIFNPFQIDAFRLAKEMRAFAKEIGPVPQLDQAAYDSDSGSGDQRVRAMAAQYEAHSRWYNKLVNKYERDFAPRVKDLHFRFGDEGISLVSHLRPFVESISDVEEMSMCATMLETMALQISGFRPGESR